MVKGAARVNDLIGPFDTWKEACDYAVAWRALWVQQRAKAFVEAPISPCPETLEWYHAKMEQGRETPYRRAACEARETVDGFDRMSVAPIASEARSAIGAAIEYLDLAHGDSNPDVNGTIDVLNRIAKTAF